MNYTCSMNLHFDVVILFISTRFTTLSERVGWFEYLNGTRRNHKYWSALASRIEDIWYETSKVLKDLNVNCLILLLCFSFDRKPASYSRFFLEKCPSWLQKFQNALLVVIKGNSTSQADWKKCVDSSPLASFFSGTWSEYHVTKQRQRTEKSANC